ncbi:MAG: ABC transporter ATP-binding protein [Candidatus Bathyarchaeia archaeon]
MPEEILLEAKEIEGGYGDFKVLHGLSFCVKKGSITCILGPNGSGKSTILKTIIGALTPWSGTILCEGVNITNLPVHKRVKMGIALVPEGRRIFGDMTVIENLEMGAYLKEARVKFNEMLERVFSLFPVLKERKEQRASCLSGGEQQMLAIARGLLTNPKLLMIDEPSLGLSPKLAQNLMKMLGKLRDEEGLTILLVEQNISLTREIMDYGYVLSGGFMIAEGQFKDLVGNHEVKRAYLGL